MYSDSNLTRYLSNPQIISNETTSCLSFHFQSHYPIDPFIKKINLPIYFGTLSMFPVQCKKFELPVLEYSPITDAYDEIELLGFPISISMFDLLKTNFRGEIQAKVERPD